GFPRRTDADRSRAVDLIQRVQGRGAQRLARTASILGDVERIVARPQAAIERSVDAARDPARPPEETVGDGGGIKNVGSQNHHVASLVLMIPEKSEHWPSSFDRLRMRAKTESSS